MEGQRGDSNELQDTLESFAAEGEKDSEGQFTLSLDKALQKLGAFQLPTPESWILVLIQAANRGKATEVKIRQSATATSVEIQGLPTWEWDELTPYLASPSDDGTFLSRLGVAFRALGSSQNKHDFEITTPAGTRVLRNGEGWVEKPPSFLERLRGEITAIRFQHFDQEAQQLSSSDRRKAGQRVQLALLTTVREGAMASPVLVSVDGLRINNPLDGGGAVGQERRLIALLRATGTGCPTARFPIARNWRSTNVGLRKGSSRTYRIPEANLTTQVQSEECSALAALWVALQREGSDKEGTWRLDSQPWRLHWIKDGVLIHTRDLKLEGRLSMSIFLCADDLSTDLTGLRLRWSPETTKRREELNGLLHQQLSELVKTAQKGVYVGAHWKPWYTAVLAGCSFVGGIVTGGLNSLGVTMLVSFYLGLGAWAHSDALSEEDALLDKELEKLPQRSRSVLR